MESVHGLDAIKVGIIPMPEMVSDQLVYDHVTAGWTEPAGAAVRNGKVSGSGKGNGAWPADWMGQKWLAVW